MMESEQQQKGQWPPGIIQHMNLVCQSSFVIVDNSRNMLRKDRYQLVNCNGAVEISQCSRWEEIKSVVLDMARVSIAASNSLEIRLLNDDAQPIVVVGHTDTNPMEELARVSALLTSQPQGLIPLCAQLQEVTAQLQDMKNKSIRQTTMTSTSLIIMSNGNATDGDVIALLRPLLESLSVRIMVRLCTDETDVVTYWQDIQTQLTVSNLSITLLGDHITIAAQVAHHNPWLTYGEPLHRLREFGMNVPPLEYLSTRALSEPEMRYVVSMLVKETDDTSGAMVMGPEGVGVGVGFEEGLKGDLPSFVNTIRAMMLAHEPNTNTASNAQETEVFCPIRRVHSKWVNLEMLMEIYGGGGGGGGGGVSTMTDNTLVSVRSRGLSPASSAQHKEDSTGINRSNSNVDEITTTETLQKMIDELQNNNSNNNNNSSNTHSHDQTTPATASLQEIIDRLLEKGQKDEQQITALQQRLALVSGANSDLTRALSTAAQQISNLETEKTLLEHETGSARASGKDETDNMSITSRALSSSDITSPRVAGGGNSGGQSLSLARLKQQVSRLTEENQSLRGKLEALINDQIEVPNLPS